MIFFQNILRNLLLLAIFFNPIYFFANQINEVANVDFFDSMQLWGTYQRTEAEAVESTMIAKKLYDKFFHRQYAYSEIPKIPKIIHQIWLGGPLPELYRSFQASWLSLNPTWKYMFWTKKEIDEFGLVNREAFEKVSNLAAKSDIARYEILYRIGGLYVDTDFECLKSFDCLCLNHYLDFYAGCVDSSKIILLNGLIASRQGHPILKRCIDNIKNSNFVDPRDPVEIMNYTGPYMFTRAFFDSLSEDVGCCVIFPLSYFYPFPAFLRNVKPNLEQVKKQWVKEESFAIHWWECSWQKKS